ncbi:MAG: glycosyltransferase family 1 protein, partial [candidate division Zixibacteria bacterium]|nr:glycosyltransferase family 1 protein [candidate division Zixibacteria bacterium]
DEILDPRVLTIGFARRFSTYKRAFMLFSDEKRLEQLLCDPDRPVQILIAGKAHPLDNPGKEIIKKVLDLASKDKFRKKIVFLEDYDINVARYLVQGVDIWLNNPRRPQEASGTSGMKAAVNGALNVSILDGWWCEGYIPQTGFKIGNGEEYENADYQDELEGKFLYDVLEREVIPLFYKRNGASLPTEWVTMMKNSIAMASKDFSSHRMVKDYTLKSYLPAIEAFHLYSSDNYKVAKETSNWLKELHIKWKHIDLKEINTKSKDTSPKVGDAIPITLMIYLGDISPKDINVEVLAGNLNSLEQMNRYKPVTASLVNGDGSPESGIYTYQSEVVCLESGRFGIAARVMPSNKNLIHNRIPKLIKWW